MATTEIYTLSLHDALPISSQMRVLPECATNYVVVIGESLTTFRLSFFGYGDRKRHV